MMSGATGVTAPSLLAHSLRFTSWSWLYISRFIHHSEYYRELANI